MLTNNQNLFKKKIPKTRRLISLVLGNLGIIITLCEFFSTIVTWRSFTEWQQVASNLQDSPQYSDRS